MVLKNVAIPLFSNEVVEIKLGSTLGQIEKFRKTINLDKGTSMVKAILNVSVSQTYLSGADLQATLNRSNLNPPLRWNAFETQTKSYSYNITNNLVSGVNEFDFLYRTAYGVASDQKANVSADILLTVDTADPSQPGVSTGSTSQGDLGREIGEKVKSVIYWIVGGLVFAGILVVAAYAVKYNFKKYTGL